MTGAGLPEAWHSSDTRRPMATDRLRGTDVKLGGAATANENDPRSTRKRQHDRINFKNSTATGGSVAEWVSVLYLGAEGPGFKSQPRRCQVTVSGKLFTPIVPLFTKQRNW